MLFWGKVIHGQKRGKILGFPTANIAIHKKIPEGIYVSYVQIKKNVFCALTFVGKAVTFGATKTYAESFLLDYSGNLYEKYITVILLKKIRENKKFVSEKSLVWQMKKDVIKAKNFFAKNH